MLFITSEDTFLQVPQEAGPALMYHERFTGDWTLYPSALRTTKWAPRLPGSQSPVTTSALFVYSSVQNKYYYLLCMPCHEKDWEALKKRIFSSIHPRNRYEYVTNSLSSSGRTSELTSIQGYLPNRHFQLPKK